MVGVRIARGSGLGLRLGLGIGLGRGGWDDSGEPSPDPEPSIVAAPNLGAGDDGEAAALTHSSTQRATSHLSGRVPFIGQPRLLRVERVSGASSWRGVTTPPFPPVTTTAVALAVHATRKYTAATRNLL